LTLRAETEAKEVKLTIPSVVFTLCVYCEFVESLFCNNNDEQYGLSLSFAQTPNRNSLYLI